MTKIEPGKTQELIVVKKVDFGVYLSSTSATEADEILLPKLYVPDDTKTGDVIDVFVYRDSEDRLIATTLKPYIEIGGIARLKVKDITKIGAFLDWGLPKDLFLPFKEQLYPVEAGDEILVTLYTDKSERLCASMRVYEHLLSDSEYKKDDEVCGKVYEISKNFGVFVAVDDKYSALIPANEVFEEYRINQSVTARVSNVLEDGRLCLSVKKKIPDQMKEDAEMIYECLEISGGFLPFHDKTSPEIIKKEFHMSKNAFKRALGHLKKSGKIDIEEKGIRII